MKNNKTTVKAFDWFDGTTHKITLSRENDRNYKIELDGAIWSRYNTFGEAYDEINEIMKLYDWKLVPAI